MLRGPDSCQRSKSRRVNPVSPRFAKSIIHQRLRALAPCWKECGGKKRRHSWFRWWTMAQTFFELGSIGQRSGFLNGRCRHSCRWSRCQLNLGPGIHIEHEPANKYRRRNSIDAPQEETWRHLKKCGDNARGGICLWNVENPWACGSSLATPCHSPIVKIAAIGRLPSYYALISEYCSSWNWCFPAATYIGGSPGRWVQFPWVNFPCLDLRLRRSARRGPYPTSVQKCFETNSLEYGNPLQNNRYPPQRLAVKVQKFST